MSACPRCKGARYYLVDVPTTDVRFGKAQPCPECAGDYSRLCGLTEAERQYSADSIEGKGATHQLLRWLVADCVSNPIGMLTLWGTFGTAKTMAIQAVVATLVRQRRAARFITAKGIEQRWFADMHGDSSNSQVFLTAPVLAIDELDKVNLRNDWVRQQFQALMDARYRTAVDGESMTLITLNGRPEEVLPGDITSRLADGRFYRQWPDGAPDSDEYVIKRWDTKAVPGVIQLGGRDARPYMRPHWAAERHE